jgi:hypothetical protein
MLYKKSLIVIPVLIGILAIIVHSQISVQTEIVTRKITLDEAKQRFENFKKQYDERLLLPADQRFANRERFTDEMKNKMIADFEQLITLYPIKNKRNRLTINRDENGKVIGIEFDDSVPVKVREYLLKNKDRLDKSFLLSKSSLKKPDFSDLKLPTQNK